MSCDCQFHVSAFTVLLLVQPHVGVDSQCVVYVYPMSSVAGSIAWFDEMKVIALSTETA